MTRHIRAIIFGLFLVASLLFGIVRADARTLLWPETMVSAAQLSLVPSYVPTPAPRWWGLDCQEHRRWRWRVRACAGWQVRGDQLGQLEARPVAVIAGYRGSARRPMHFLAAARGGGLSTVRGSRLTVRRVAVGPWQTPAGTLGGVRGSFRWTWPNGKESATRVYSDS